MKINNDILTIGMPVYNDIKFLTRAIESILNQTFKSFQLLICDDHSTDGSQEICLNFAKSDNRIKYIRNSENKGITLTLKYLLEMSETKYFMWAANDDYWHTEFIEKLITELENDNKIVSVFATYVQVNENGSVISKEINEDYESDSIYFRLKKMIQIKSDGMGYGIFRTDKIKKMRFTRWNWPNNKCAYNNIYPLLFYILSRGPYRNIKTKPLWFNTIKNNENINHKIPFNHNFTLCYFAFIIRKLNLIFECSISILLNGKIRTFCRVFPNLFYSWFFIPCFINIKGKYNCFKQSDFSCFI